MRSSLALSTLLVYSAAFVAAIGSNLIVHHKPSPGRGHAHVQPAQRGLNGSVADANAVLVMRDLEKRFEGARFTFYDAGLGACGQWNSNSDFIVALTATQWSGGAHCSEMVTITVNGKTTTARVMDQCMGCPYGGLDFSRGLFNYFAPESAGVLTGSWYFGSGPAAASPSPTTTYKPSTTPTPTPVTMTSSKPLTTSSTVILSHSSSSSAVDPLKSTLPSTTAADGNLEQFNLAFVGIGAIAYAAAHSN